MAKIKTRARALDMLGRQQIAGIPTALSELFKNAHDAYADHVEVDFIRKINTLILRDDGLGMTREEFEQRWLTIGTDSKYQHTGSMDMPEIDTKKAKRAIMGEKGIGRLAIAAIGPQTLVLTRSKRTSLHNSEIEVLGNLVVAFVNWSLFSLPGIDLDDIDIPIIEVEGGSMISKEEFINLIEQSKENLINISNKIPSISLIDINNQLDLFSKFDPASLINIPQGPSLVGDGHGTQFVISPIDETLSEDIDNFATSRNGDASRLEKGLLGFTNTMSIENSPPIIAKFRDHTLDGECIERIGENTFFTPDEYKIADHHIKGNFDEYGQFNGVVTIYGENMKDYPLSWPNGKNKPTKCGPFGFNLAYVHGMQKDTKLPPEIWKGLISKTDRIGGIYIYRDGIRVLPYGDLDFDFLGIEKRRTMKASTFFFSHRRMFGYIEITRELNYSLQEKAGREGFIENSAYRQFKDILENFLIQVASDIFNLSGDLSEYYNEKRGRLNKEYELLLNRAKNIKPKREKLKKELDSFYENLQNNLWEVKISELDSLVNNLLHDLSLDLNNEKNNHSILSIENKVKYSFSELLEKTKITRPSGVGLSKELSDLWDGYQAQKEIIINNRIKPAQERISKKISLIEAEISSNADIYRRLEKSIHIQIEQQNNQVSQHIASANRVLTDVQLWAKKVINDEKEKAKNNFNTIRSNFSSQNIDSYSNESIFDFKQKIENKIDESSENIITHIENLVIQLNSIKEFSLGDNSNSSNTIAALESQYEKLKDEHSKNIELAQLGMAIGVIHHEFESHIRGIRRSLKELKPWADKNERLQKIFLTLRTSFDHLDGYLSLFTPLSRRLNRKKINVTGGAIYDFLIDIFDEKLKENNIEIKYTSDFLEKAIFTYTSSIFPAFVNIVDNAIYWVCQTERSRIINLGTTSTGFYILDSGPGVAIKDRERIFEYSFSRKNGGRGMGLYISLLSLQQVDLKFYLDEFNANNGACFVIEPSDIVEGEL
ncbi:ATP-binding protein [Yersinia enterocolitica]|uniref:ATP-binding protein n=1 Tax=Yersinia enterocolitica TaxID=630 RepID=UPI00398D498D